MKIKLAVLTLALAGAAPALAQNVTADPQKLAAVMRTAGYQAELGTDNVGDPMITSAAAGSKFVVLFYNCTNHTACLTIQFQTAWAMKIKPTLAAVNEWNHGNRFGRAYIDKEGDPGIMMDINLDKGGMSPGLFSDNLEVWATVLGNFKKAMVP
ncbi:MAG TPA: YbjN domain-containing protein [Allosphingosinicella sp.]|jgi:hypothetical protein|nr:YbjN domain-containing protein [Allosphingosinicella sp.]